MLLLKLLLLKTSSLDNSLYSTVYRFINISTLYFYFNKTVYFLHLDVIA